MRVDALLLCALALIAADDAAAQTLRASYPEGPLWQGERLYYAEMGADRVSVYENGARRRFFSQRGCGPTAIAPYAEGFIVLCHRGARIVAVDAEGRETRRWTHDARGNALRDPNDATADEHGGVYLSDPGRFDASAGAEGYVLYLDASGALARVAGPLRYPNGVHVAGDALLVSEHLGGRVLRFVLESPTRVNAPDVVVDLAALRTRSRFRSRYSETGPDGLEIGPDGQLHVAIYGEGRVLRFSAEGALLGETQVATRYVTNVAFARDGAMAVTGAFENQGAPYRGQVRITPAR